MAASMVRQNPIVVAIAALILGVILGALVTPLLLESGGSTSEQQEPSQGEEAPGNVTVDLLEEIKKKGVIVVGTSADWPPYEYIDSEGNFAGIDIVLAQKIAEGLGVELKIVDMKFAALFQAVQSGKVDIVIADVAMKPERFQAVDFTIPYRCETSKAIIVTEEQADSYSGYEWLQGKKIGAQSATVEEELATEFFGEKSEIVAYDRVYPEMTLALKSGKIDAMITAPDVAKIILAMEGGLEIVDTIPYFGCSAVVVPHNQYNLKQAISQIIWDLLQSGELEEIIASETAKWLEQQG